MVPDVAQQLAAIRHMLAKTVIPAIDPGEGFAQEQAGLILASLDWLLDVETAQQRYERLEHADQRALLEKLVAIADHPGADLARRLLVDTLAPPDDYTVLRAQTVELKERTSAAFEEITAGGAGADAEVSATRVLDEAGRRQLAREQAWFRMTGFTTDASRSISQVLDLQEA